MAPAVQRYFQDGLAVSIDTIFPPGIGNGSQLTPFVQAIRVVWWALNQQRLNSRFIDTCTCALLLLSSLLLDNGR